MRDHLLQDKKVEKRLGFDMTSSWEASQAGLLLAGQQVFFTPGEPACSIYRMVGFWHDLGWQACRWWGSRTPPHQLHLLATSGRCLALTRRCLGRCAGRAAAGWATCLSPPRGEEVILLPGICKLQTPPSAGDALAGLPLVVQQSCEFQLGWASCPLSQLVQGGEQLKHQNTAILCLQELGPLYAGLLPPRRVGHCCLPAFQYERST